MKKCLSNHLAVIAICFIIAGSAVNQSYAQDSSDKGVNALLLMSRDYGVNYFLNRDVFEQYGWNITHTGVLDTIPACAYYYYRLGVPSIIPDMKTSEITDLTNYDCFMIMPSTSAFSPIPFDEFLHSPPVLSLVNKAVKENLAVYSVCSGARVLAAADVLSGVEVVGNPQFQAEYEAAGATFLGKDHPAAIDGNIITCGRDLYYNIPNCQAIATVVENRQGRGDHKKSNNDKFIFAADANLADSGLIWSKTIGGPGADGGKSIRQTPDGGFIIVGYTFSHGTGDADILAVKTDSKGKQLWSKTYGGAGTEYGYDCIIVDDGYIITGYTTSYGAGSKDVYLVKINKDGKLVWSNTYGGASWDVGMSAAQAGDGGYIICGFTNSSGAGEEDLYLIKTDANGKQIWTKTYGGERFEMGNSVYQTGDGGFIVGATSGTTEGGNCDFYLMKTDAKGNEIWSQFYASAGPAGHGFDWCSSMTQSADGGYILVGYSDCTDNMNAHVTKTDADGQELWTVTFGKSEFYDYGNYACATPDGGAVILGTAKQIGEGIDFIDNDIYLVKLSGNGDILWEKTFGNAGSDWGNSMCLTKNGDYVILGQTDANDHGSYDALLMRITE